MASSAARQITRGLYWYVSLFTCLQVGSEVVHAQGGPSIREQLAETGGFERVIVSADDPMPLAQLASRAKLVVEASVTASQSYLDEPGLDVFTDYTMVIHSVIKARERSPVQTGDSITVRRRHGAVVVDGRKAEVRENGFPPFESGARYILFLTREPRDYVYRVLGGSEGAFSSGENVRSMTTPADDADAPRLVTHAEFLGEVHALLKFTEY